MEKKNQNKYVIGVDGGGFDTVVALAGLNGKILKTRKGGSASLRNVGIKKAIENIVKIINQLLKDKKGIKIVSTFVGLPAVAEEFKYKKKEIKKELLRHKNISKIFKGKITIGSDQDVGFRAGTNERDGIVLISGTGCVARGRRKNKEFRVAGWGWLNDEGSAFWVGQKVFQVLLKDLDGRGSKTLLTREVFKKFKIKKIEDLVDLVYSKSSTEIISQFSIICAKASKKRDKGAKSIMFEAGRELALMAKTVIKKLNFKEDQFPLVLIGGMFQSKIILDIVKKEIKKTAPRVKFIKPQKDPVIGAVKLAIEEIKNGKDKD